MNPRKSPVKRGRPAKKSPAKSGRPVKKSPAKRGRPAKKSPAKRGRPVKKSPAKRGRPVKKSPAKRGRPAKKSQRKRSPRNEYYSFSTGKATGISNQYCEGIDVLTEIKDLFYPDQFNTLINSENNTLHNYFRGLCRDQDGRSYEPMSAEAWVARVHDLYRRYIDRRAKFPSSNFN